MTAPDDLPPLPEGAAYHAPWHGQAPHTVASEGQGYRVMLYRPGSLDTGKTEYAKVEGYVPLPDLLAVLAHLRALSARAPEQGGGNG